MTGRKIINVMNYGYYIVKMFRTHGFLEKISCMISWQFFLRILFDLWFFFQNHKKIFTDLFVDNLFKMMENDDGVGGIGDIDDSALLALLEKADVENTSNDNDNAGGQGTYTIKTNEGVITPSLVLIV